MSSKAGCFVLMPAIWRGGLRAKPTVRVYPTPNRVVTDSSVGEFVGLLTCRGAVLGSKLG